MHNLAVHAAPPIAASTSMLHDLTNQLPIPNHALHLLRQRPLHVIVIVAFPRHDDIDARAQTREDLRPETFAAEIEGRAVDLVEHDGRQGAEDLHLELGALDDVDGGDEGVDDEGDGGAVVERDGVGFAVDADGGFRAA